MSESELTEIGPPVGQFIIDQKDIQALEMADGHYYHYTEVISLMKRYADKKTSDEIDRYKQLLLIALTRHWHKKTGDEIYDLVESLTIDEIPN